MATVALGTKEVGSIVKLNVSGTPREFTVVHQGKPGDMYDDSCDGVWLFDNTPENDGNAWGHNGNDYENSSITVLLNSTTLERFDDNTKAKIKQIKIPYRPGAGNSMEVATGENGLSVRIFLLSGTEAGKSHKNLPITGATLDYFKDGQHSPAATFTRDPCCDGTGRIFIIEYDGSLSTSGPSSNGPKRFALILSPTLLVSDEGMIETVPAIPTSINIPESVQGGTNLDIMWGAPTISDDNSGGYELERQVDGGDWVQVYQGPNTSYTDAITRGWLTVAYRVRAYDSYGAYSDYTTSSTREVNNNRAPAITCTPASGADLGVKGEDFSVAYSASDADGDPVTVTEAIDGVTLRTFTPEGEESCTFALTGETFMKLLNGAHELSITASDGQAQAVHTLTFTKSVTAASITLAQPMEADGPITLCVLSVTGSIPEDADYSVQVTNNALDDAPVWEDCTDEVRLGANHVFTNDTAANGFAFNFLVSVERGESGQGGYINSVQGGFQ